MNIRVIRSKSSHMRDSNGEMKANIYLSSLTGLEQYNVGNEKRKDLNRCNSLDMEAMTFVVLRHKKKNWPWFRKIAHIFHNSIIVLHEDKVILLTVSRMNRISKNLIHPVTRLSFYYTAT